MGGLAQFTGSQMFFRDPYVREIIFTEGIRYLLEEARFLAAP
jgi:hypothetical protein